MNAILRRISKWWDYYLSDPDKQTLLLFMLTVTALFFIFSEFLAPVFASVVIAYLLDVVIKHLQNYMPRKIAVYIVYTITLSLVLLGLLVVLPLVWQQVRALLHDLPAKITRGQAFFTQLQASYPQYVSAEQVQTVLAEFKADVAKFGQVILSISLNTIPGIIVLVVYFVLVPLLVYFFLMDKEVIMAWIGQYMPKHRRLLQQVWVEVQEQIGNYVGGRVLEVVLVTVVTHIVFSILGLNYSLLLASLVGLSVIVPYIGIIVVTVPVVIIALFQWGWSSHFAYTMIAYTVLTIIDANVLVPLLFGEAIQVHPVAIIIAILFFGGIGGFWGIFFAIPLAGLVKALLGAWQQKEITAT
ncbi:MAG: AI-2E family transporter [Gammaproteobacteria bacterium]